VLAALALIRRELNWTYGAARRAQAERVVRAGGKLAIHYLDLPVSARRSCSSTACLATAEDLQRGHAALAAIQHYRLIDRPGVRHSGDTAI